jgi:hypothetical protein
MTHRASLGPAFLWFFARIMKDKGAYFLIWNTDRSFSRAQADLHLEQTNDTNATYDAF